MEREVIKKVLKIIIFLSIFMILFCTLGVFFNPTGTINEWFQSYTVIEFYKEKENSIDVLYVGNSCIYTGISPMEIYKNTGITGYSFSTSGQKIVSSYYFIKEALRSQSPKVVFLEIGEAFSKKEDNEELNTRRAIDSLKFSKVKLEMILDSDYGLSGFDKLSCIFPLLRYHSRWSNLDESDFRKFINKDIYTYKGYLLDGKVSKYAGPVDKHFKKEIDNQKELEEELAKIPKEVKEKIDKIIEVCAQNDCKLVFIKIPEPKSWNDEKHEIISEYAKEKNIDFIDLNYDDKINIDWQNDTQDGGNHLNIFGAEKIGVYLSQYLQNNFNLEDHRNDANYESWNDLLVKYNEAKENKMKDKR